MTTTTDIITTRRNTCAHCDCEGYHVDTTAGEIATDGRVIQAPRDLPWLMVSAVDPSGLECDGCARQVEACDGYVLHLEDTGGRVDETTRDALLAAAPDVRDVLPVSSAHVMADSDADATRAAVADEMLARAAETLGVDTDGLVATLVQS